MLTISPHHHHRQRRYSSLFWMVKPGYCEWRAIISGSRGETCVQGEDRVLCLGTLQLLQVKVLLLPVLAGGCWGLHSYPRCANKAGVALHHNAAGTERLRVCVGGQLCGESQS